MIKLWRIPNSEVAHAWALGPAYRLIVFVLLLGADDAQKDTKNFQGTWSVVKAEGNGETMRGVDLKKSKVVFQGDTITIAGGEREEKANFKLELGKKPKAIDITPAKGDMKSAVGIYELNGDTLTLCWRKFGGERPTEFKTVPNSGLFLFVLQREKKE